MGVADEQVIFGKRALICRERTAQNRDREQAPLLGVLPSSWNDAISPYLPSNAGTAILWVPQDPHSLAPWTGFALFCGYAAITLAAAAILLVRRDT